jgi:glycosyltransferase involved in cell wall biosynthesis
MNRSLPVIAIVLPCYNEQEALPITLPRLLSLLDDMSTEGLISPESFLLCSNDGSRDGTWHLLEEWHARDNRVKAVSLAHNRGHQYALLAGLMAVRGRCDASVSIDADLQDDPEAIRTMVLNFKSGDDIVYGVRSSRATDTWFKRSTAHAFYSFQNRMGLETIYDHADYRLMSCRALDLLAEYGESNLFLRGIVPNIGLKSSIVTYERASRVAGESKYPLSKMLALSIDGITSFSAKPMRMIFLTGLALWLIDIVVAVWVFVAHFCGHTISGWSSLMLSVWFLGSLILMGIGIVGEYIGKIFVEVKHRPRFAIAEEIW